MNSKYILFLAFLIYCATLYGFELKKDAGTLNLKIEFGNISENKQTQYVSLYSLYSNVNFSTPIGSNIEKDDIVSNESILKFGEGDVDELVFDVTYTNNSETTRGLPDNAEMWKFLLKNGSDGQIKRLSDDIWNKEYPLLITIRLNEEGSKGFSFGLEQLSEHKALWIPEHDIFITTAESEINFTKHLASLEGKRILDVVQESDDATLKEFKQKWTDVGDPTVSDPSWEKWQTNWMDTNGHLVITTSAHGSLYKFAIDRWANVRPDFASPYKFQMDFDWNGYEWIGQSIVDGLPIIKTSLSHEDNFYEIEQFAFPLMKKENYIEGYIPGILCSKINISGNTGPVDLNLALTNYKDNSNLKIKNINKHRWLVYDNQLIIMMIESESDVIISKDKNITSKENDKFFITLNAYIENEENIEVILKSLSPPVSQSLLDDIISLNYENEKRENIKYWEEWLGKGALFNVPEKEINDLYRANLWHSLVLPRHIIGLDNKPQMDIPYANTAYGQSNADWPINQAVYVDYMIYGLRGYYNVAEEEFHSMFKTQQLPEGKIGGFANWAVYSPGQLFSIAQNYLLSHDKEQFERLLPNSLKLLDWCLLQIENSNKDETNKGLIIGPLNDLSKEERAWAFTQAYYYSGLETFSRALKLYGHPMTDKTFEVAQRLKKDIESAFSEASVNSPIVQLADGSWTNFVPTDAMTPRRQMDQWYPTDIDTGPLHLTRLGVLDANGFLTNSMLNDHEDNLFYHNLGAANEPVYIPQANIYLMQDNPKAVIRSFYSMTASAFSHNQLSPIEHRWGHPQYYGPPSTDGAWFEIYRRMLLNEIDHATLYIGQAIPRDWLTTDKEIRVENAPSYFGPVSFLIKGLSTDNKININLTISNRNPPKELIIRFRHPESKPIRSVMINGKRWHDFDISNEYIKITNLEDLSYNITASY